MREVCPGPLVATAASLTTAVTGAVEVLERINSLRAAHGIAHLRAHKETQAAAQRHAEDMSARNYVNHRTPEGLGVGQRLDAAGHPGYAYVGENLCAGFPTAADAVNAWWNSPGHRRNLLDSNFSQAGVGFVHDPDDAHGVLLWSGDVGGPYYDYWVLVFVQPMVGVLLPSVEVNGNG